MVKNEDSPELTRQLGNSDPRRELAQCKEM